MLSAITDCAHMFQIKLMTPDDFDFAVRLTDQMNWDMTDQDFRFMTTLEPEGCFVLLSDKEKVGIATTISYGKIGWFGNLIVEKAYRNRGAGSLLVNHSIKYLKGRKVETIGLYSYVNKIPFYERIGFRKDSDFIVLKGRAIAYSREAEGRSITGNDMSSIVDYDALCFGGNRGKLLKPLLGISHNVSHMSAENGRIVGYSIAKVYDDTAELGPLICDQGHSETAISLLNSSLNDLEGHEVSLCLSTEQSDVAKALKKLHFRDVFPVTRMFLGPAPASGSKCVYAAESLERG